MPLRPSERAELRRSGFKDSVGTEEASRLRRERTTVQIRKAARGSALQKRRRAAAVEAEAAPHAPPDLDSVLGALPLLAQGLRSDDGRAQLEAARELRKLLSTENPPIELVNCYGVLSCFVQLLSREDSPELQHEATRALANITLGTSENIKVVVAHGAVPFFVKLLMSPHEDIVEQAVLALGNVAGGPPLFRDMVLSSGALFPLLQLLNGHTKLSILRKATGALWNFCRSLPPANFEQVKPALPILRQLIHSQDEEILSDVCWALFDLSSDSGNNMQAVIESGVCPRVVELLIHSSPWVLIPALHVIGNIARGGYAHIQCIIDHQALPCLYNILTTNQKRGVKGEVCSTICSIMAGNKDQIQAVINANIIGPLVHCMLTGEFDVKKNAAWAISNATAGGTHDQIRYIVSQGCIKAFCNLLGYADTSVLAVCLKGLENILRIEEAKEPSQLRGVNIYAQMIDDADGLDKIENLQIHENNVISEMAAHLLKSCRRQKDNDTPWLDPDLTLFEEETLLFGNDFDISDLPGDLDFG